MKRLLTFMIVASFSTGAFAFSSGVKKEACKMKKSGQKCEKHSEKVSPKPSERSTASVVESPEVGFEVPRHAIMGSPSTFNK